MTVDEMVEKHAANKSEEEWIRKMVPMMMAAKKHEYLEKKSNSN